jgi:hypothetical protein
MMSASDELQNSVIQTTSAICFCAQEENGFEFILLNSSS